MYVVNTRNKAVTRISKEVSTLHQDYRFRYNLQESTLTHMSYSVYNNQTAEKNFEI